MFLLHSWQSNHKWWIGAFVRERRSGCVCGQCKFPKNKHKNISLYGLWKQKLNLTYAVLN